MTYISLTKAEHSVVDAISATKHEMLSIVKDWSSINSGSYNHSGLKDMRERLSDSFSSLPGEISELTLEEGQHIDQKGNIETINYESALKISVRPKAPIQLVLTGHYDTVFPVDSHFQNYETIGDGILKGPGVADMKGGIVVMKTALQFFETMPISKNIGYNILLSPDEEIGSLGSASILEDLGRASHAGLTYEPSLPDGSLAGARKGSGNFTVIIKGRAAHAGREHHLGRNAIVAMAEFINGLEKLNGKREGLTINIAKIEGGGPSNIVPDLSIGHFNIRMQEEEDMQWVSNKINNQPPFLLTALSGGSSSYSDDKNIIYLSWSGGSGTYDLTLPSATDTPYRNIQIISDGTLAANDKVHVLAPVGERIDGAINPGFYTLNKPFNGVTVWSDGTQWVVIQAKAT